MTVACPGHDFAHISCDLFASEGGAHQSTTRNSRQQRGQNETKWRIGQNRNLAYTVSDEVDGYINKHTICRREILE